MMRPRREAEVDGTPALALRDQDREAIAEALAEWLIEVLDRESKTAPARRPPAGANRKDTHDASHRA
jgi:hypothetical protein